MRPLRYTLADDAASAVALVVGSPTACFLGGGTNLVDLMKLGVVAPDHLVDITRLAGFRDISGLEGGGVRIGAGVRNSDLAAHPLIRRNYPVLSRALLSGASGQLRNLATVGGNLLQRTRCWYFQDITKPCNKRSPGSGCPAIDGEHRNLAILGGSPACIATHASDLCVALACLDAAVLVSGPGARARSVPVAELYRLPERGDNPGPETNLDHGDLITAVEIPPLAFGRHSDYRKVRDRASYAFVVVSVAAAIDVADGRVRDVRLALGAVAPVPWRARLAEAALIGRPATAEHFRAALEVELAQAQPLRDNEFKVPLARNVAAATLVALVAGTASP